MELILMSRMIGEGISYANVKTYNSKKYICNICGNKYNSIDNAMICIDAHNNEEVIRS